MVFEALHGRAAFNAQTVSQVEQRIRTARLSFAANLSTHAKAFVQSLLTVEANQRPDASTALDHPWLSQHLEVPQVDA